MAIALADLLDEKRIKLDLRAIDQARAVRELVDLIAIGGSVRDPNKLVDLVLERELTNSTLAEDGVAFPHARTDLAEKIVLAIGRSVDGIPWNDNGERAHLIFLVGVPQKMINDYLVVIGTIARTTKDDALRTLLLHAENVAEFIATMKAAPSI
jgi:mannitol/fructose-specific phosphotransferase system IIA component (Ntr-type)